MRTLTAEHIVHLHRIIVQRTGGPLGIRDRAAIESAAAQPRMTFDGIDLYPTLPAKAAAMAHLLISNHPFVDGNKRVGHAALETMLVLNGLEINADIDEQETVILHVAAGDLSRERFIEWVQGHVREFDSEGSTP